MWTFSLEEVLHPAQIVKMATEHGPPEELDGPRVVRTLYGGENHTHLETYRERGWEVRRGDRGKELGADGGREIERKRERE